MAEQPQAVRAWHAVVESGDFALPGKDLTAFYLTKLVELMQRQLTGSQA
jgi:hypothetical protein